MFLLVGQCDGVKHSIEPDVVDEEEAQDHGEEDSKEDNPELFEEGGEYHRPNEVHTKNYQKEDIVKNKESLHEWTLLCPDSVKHHRREGDSDNGENQREAVDGEADSGNHDQLENNIRWLDQDLESFFDAAYDG